LPSYDPDPRRHRRSRGHRRGIEPAGLKRWRLAHRHRTHDPGRAKYKPLHYGHRGGTYFQGPTRRRYDPDRFERLRSYGRRARGYGSKVESGISKYGSILGFFGVLGIGLYSGYTSVAKWFTDGGFGKDKPDPTGATSPEQRYWNLLTSEYSHLYKSDGQVNGWNPASYLKYKFLGTQPDGTQTGSAWVIPFWLSLIGTLASPIAKLFTNKGQRFLRPIHKISTGALAASTIGALALPGCGETQPGLPAPPAPQNCLAHSPQKVIEYTYTG